MSHENVEIVRKVIEAHERGDFATVFAAYDPQVEWNVTRTQEDAMGGLDLEPVYYGRAGIRTFWRAWFAAWEQVSFEYQEFIDAGDKVVSVLSQRMRGRTSGLDLEWNSYAQVWTVYDGKIARVEFFPTRGEALKAVGMAE